MSAAGQDATAHVVAHEAFVREQARRWTAKLPHLMMHEDDLIQEGRLGLLWAAERFDAERGVKFLTFAARAVFNLQRNFVDRCSHQVRFPKGQSISWLYFDAPCGEGDELSLSDMMAPEMSEPGMWEDEGVRELLRREMGRMTAQEVEVLRGRFVERVKRSITARRLGLTRERIRQIEVKALEKLRRRMMPRLCKGGEL